MTKDRVQSSLLMYVSLSARTVGVFSSGFRQTVEQMFGRLPLLGIYLASVKHKQVIAALNAYQRETRK